MPDGRGNHSPRKRTRDQEKRLEAIAGLDARSLPQGAKSSPKTAKGVISKAAPVKMDEAVTRTNILGYFSMRLIQFSASPIKFFCEEF
jgi:hypothetical protein